MNESQLNHLREIAWRRKLTAAEEAELRAGLEAHPDLGADWEAESNLTEALERLPEAPVPTNFTARVVQAVERETAASGRAGFRGFAWWRSFLPRAAVALAVLFTGVFAYQRHRAIQRADLAGKVAVVSDVVAVADPELLRDLEAIRQLDDAAGPDNQLLALLETSSLP